MLANVFAIENTVEMVHAHTMAHVSYLSDSSVLQTNVSARNMQNECYNATGICVSGLLFTDFNTQSLILYHSCVCVCLFDFFFQTKYSSRERNENCLLKIGSIYFKLWLRYE